MKKLNKKPGDIVPQQPESKFKGYLKIPGWLPDMTRKDGQYLFLEEAVQVVREGFVAFPPPSTNSQPFNEPLASASAAQWNNFNSWILGAPFNKKPQDPFDDLLAEIANHVRKYNAALYWMRRLHMHEKAALSCKGILSPPPPNPHGDLAGANPKEWDFAKLVPRAQKNWKTAVEKLNKALNKGTFRFPGLLADFIQVNDYIVSMRIVAGYGPGAKLSTEMGGSSSSHISISSAFSSS